MQGSFGKVVELNGVTYQWPSRPIVVVCVDGGDPAYFDQSLRDRTIPNTARFMKDGFNSIATSVVPSLTNPNNMSIITGAPPSIHGISGNYFVDPETGIEVMMNDPKFLRSETLLAQFSQKGAKVVAITAKDKLRKMLGKNLNIAGGSINFASETADQCTIDQNGIKEVEKLVGLPLPDVYSADLTIFALEAAVKILERDTPDIMYISTTDYIQHKHAPDSPDIKHLYAKMDSAFGRMANLGAVIGITADHGMSDKSKADGTPNVIFIQDQLDRHFGAKTTKVILPITDPYVVHHGSLGGFVRIYCTARVTPEEIMQFTKSLPGVEAVYDKQSVCSIFDLPMDREGDVVVISDADTALGASEATHDLSALEEYRLRSHGGIAESLVPFIISRPLTDKYATRAASSPLRSYEIFDYVINGVT